MDQIRVTLITISNTFPGFLTAAINSASNVSRNVISVIGAGIGFWQGVSALTPAVDNKKERADKENLRTTKKSVTS